MSDRAKTKRNLMDPQQSQIPIREGSLEALIIRQSKKRTPVPVIGGILEEWIQKQDDLPKEDAERWLQHDRKWRKDLRDHWDQYRKDVERDFNERYHKVYNQQKQQLQDEYDRIVSDNKWWIRSWKNTAKRQQTIGEELGTSYLVIERLRHDNEMLRDHLHYDIGVLDKKVKVLLNKKMHQLDERMLQKLRVREDDLKEALMND